MIKHICDKCGKEASSWDLIIPKYINRTISNPSYHYIFCYSCYLGLFEIVEQYLKGKLDSRLNDG